MSWLDLIPGVSQVKSVCQLIAGDEEGAERTQRNFYTKTPVVSHVTGAVVGTVGLICDNDEAKDFAVEAFAGGTRTVSNILDAIPLIGETKGVVHLLLGDKEGAMRAFKSSRLLFETTASLVVIGTNRSTQYEDILELIYNDRTSYHSRNDVLRTVKTLRQRMNEAYDEAEGSVDRHSECDELDKLREYRRKANEAFDNIEHKVRQH